MQSTAELNGIQVIDNKSLMEIRNQPTIESKSSVHKYSQSQIGNPKPNHMTLTLKIKQEIHITEQSKSTKYNDFLKSIKTNYFPELNNENQLILAINQYTVIPQSIDSTIEEATYGYGQVFQVRELKDFLFDMVNNLCESKGMNKEQSKKIKQLEDQIKQDKQIKYKDQYKELKKLYNNLIEEYKLLELNYHQYLQANENNEIIRDSSKQITNFNKYVSQLIDDKMKTTEQFKKYYDQCIKYEQQIREKQEQIKRLQDEKLDLEKLVTQLEKQQQQIDQHILNAPSSQQNQQQQLERIQSLQNRNYTQESTSTYDQETQTLFCPGDQYQQLQAIKQQGSQLYDQLYQNNYQGCQEQQMEFIQNENKYEQLKQQQQQQQEKEKLNQNHLNTTQEQITQNLQRNQDILQLQKKSQIRIKTTENCEQKQECKIQMISTTSIDMNKLEQEQQCQYQLRYSNQENSELITTLSICSFCNLSCKNYIQLPCLHTYHQNCLEQLGKDQCTNYKFHIACICSKKISIKLFNRATQQICLQRQAAQIFERYKLMISLRKCNDCEFFYQTNTNEQTYCPNCLK